MCSRLRKQTGKAYLIGKPTRFLVCRDCWVWVRANTRYPSSFLTRTIYWKKTPMPFKIWMDDKREAPDGWMRTYDAKETIIFLQALEVEEISLDHDLGDKETKGDGYEVACWIEEKVAFDDSYTPPEIRIHTENPVGRDKIVATKASIERLLDRRDSK